jgi:hypothetical protein
MRKTILAILIILTSTVASAQTVARPLPKLIQNLSDEDYIIWAQWQNRQSVRRAEVEDARTRWDKYDYANRIVSNSFNYGNVNVQTSGTVRSNSSTRPGNAGQTRRTGSRSMTRDSQASTNQRSGTTVISDQVRRLNPNYAGPGGTLTYNPYVRPKGGLGAPDWAILFVPCKEGTITMQEVLDRLTGPQRPEKVFKIMMEGYFDEAE